VPPAAPLRPLPGALATLAALLGAACSFRDPPTWPAVLADVRARYPDVPQVPLESLRARIDAPQEERPLLLDARSTSEYEVSHLRGALHAPDEPAALAALSDAAPEREIVVYCSVGVRSSALAEDLRARGFTRAANLEGGIFAWANAGLPMVRGDGTEEPAERVHPFDARWGALLVAERRALLE
jgi:rhodanese-related sulfurtransferase